MDEILMTPFTPETSDEKLLALVAAWQKESEPYHNRLLQSQRAAYEYYLGNQTDKDSIPPYNSNTVENRIFEAVETLVAIATAQAHRFQVLPGSDNELAVKKAELLEQVLRRKFETLNVQQKLEQITRQMLIMRFGVARYEWNEYFDDVNIRVVDPRAILVPKMRVNHLRELPYVIELAEYTAQELGTYFPKAIAKHPELTAASKDAKRIDTGQTGVEFKKTRQVMEVWTDEAVGWFTGGVVLGVEANKYYDFKGTIKRKLDRDNKRMTKQLIFQNYFTEPHKPYVFFYPFDLTDATLPNISLVEIGMPMQDAINVQKRQIINNLRSMGNGQALVDSDTLTEEETQNITNEPGLIIRGKGIASENKFRREAGVPLPTAHFSNLQHSEVVFDNVMGVHAATRGQSGAKTLGQDILAREQDVTRIDLITRALNRGVSELAEGLTQLIRLFYSDVHTIRILGEDGTLQFLRFNQDDVEDGIEVHAKGGDELPMDKVALRTEAIQLWQLQGLDPMTLFERLGFPNPEKAAQRLVAWKRGELDMETQQKLQLMEREAQLGMAATTPGEPKGRPPLNENRGTETPANVLQRAQGNLGGTAPVGALSK